MQRSASFTVLNVGVGAGLEQYGHGLGVASPDGPRENQANHPQLTPIRVETVFTGGLPGGLGYLCWICSGEALREFRLTGPLALTSGRSARCSPNDGDDPRPTVPCFAIRADERSSRPLSDWFDRCTNALDVRFHLGHSVAHAPRTLAKEAPMNTVVRARIDQATKDEATVILDTIGLTVSDAFRLMMRRIVAEKRLPFDPLVPNATTLAAIDDANRGDLDTVDSVEEMFATLRDGRDDD